MRVLLVDDEPMLLRTFAQFLALARPEWEVLTASDGTRALGLFREFPVDFLVTDIEMPGMDGMALLAEVREDPALAWLPVIFVTGRVDRASHRLGMALGADDFLSKPFTGEELVTAIEARLRRAAQGGQGSPETLALHESVRARLTERELEVLACIGRGLASKEIAARLSIRPRTVSVHRANIMKKLELHNAAALAALATRANVVT